jgi:signal transduction histidine kinase
VRFASRENAWKIGVVAVGAVLAAYVPLRNSSIGPTVYSLASLFACSAFFIGPRLQRVRGPQWKLFGFGMLFYWVADAIWAGASLLGAELPYPSFADAFYFVAYILLIVGALVLLRGTRPGTGDLLDGLLVATIAAFLIWPLVIGPSAHAGGTTLLERVVSGAYPTFDVLLLIGLAPFALATRSRGTSHGALVAGFLTLLAADLVYAVQTLKGVYADSNLINLVWIVSSGFLVVAALHPSIRRLGEPLPSRPGSLGTGRLAVIAGALAVGPVVDLAFDAAGYQAAVQPAAPVASAVAIVLVVARIAVLWRERDGAEQALQESEARYRDLYAVAEAAREQLEAQNDRLQELDRMKDSFVSLVSHELRTPLTSIRGYVELLLDEGASVDDETRSRYLDVVERNSDRLLGLVNDLLFMSQVRTDKLTLELAETRLRPLAEQCLEAVRPAADEHRVSLRLEADEDPTVAVDPVRFAQVLDNLLSNAVKFTPPRGRIELRLRVEGGNAVIHVADTGLGIARADLSQLFTPFFRAQSATAAAVPGTGLGLAVSKAIVEAHGGRIDVSSEEGVGTTFTVELPCQVGAAEHEQVAA